ncbi:hypothetical protein [Deinococcus hohokamensis]|uniref:Transposase n=1 Tax=Deinococcus hohokamensis TaxID=309883 RepID=A0ABV9IG54_9DEIO
MDDPTIVIRIAFKRTAEAMKSFLNESACAGSALRQPGVPGSRPVGEQQNQTGQHPDGARDAQDGAQVMICRLGVDRFNTWIKRTD